MARLNRVKCRAGTYGKVKTHSPRIKPEKKGRTAETVKSFTVAKAPRREGGRNRQSTGGFGGGETRLYDTVMAT